MGIKVRRYAVTVGDRQDIELAQGEDCLLLFAFTEPVPPLGNGQPVSYAGMMGSALVVRDPQGIELFGRVGVAVTAWAPSTAYALGAIVVNGVNAYLCTTAGTSAASGGPVGTAPSITDGTVTWAWLQSSPLVAVGDLAFIVVHADTVGAAVQPYFFDVTFEDAAGHTEQLQVKATFDLLDGLAQGAALTSPIPVPVIYGQPNGFMNAASGMSVSIPVPNALNLPDGRYHLSVVADATQYVNAVATAWASWEFRGIISVVGGVATLTSSTTLDEQGTAAGGIPPSGWLASLGVNGVNSYAVVTGIAAAGTLWLTYTNVRPLP